MLRHILMTAMFMVNAACVSKMISAAIPQKGQKPDEVKKVKTVAVVAFDVLEFKPTGLAGKVGGSVGAHAAMANTAVHATASKSELARDLYDELTRALTKKGWTVLPVEKVAANKVYRHFYETKKPSLLEKAPNHFQQPVVVEGIMRPVNPVYLLKPEERSALAHALNVDAIIFARVSYSTHSRDYTGLGIAPIYLQSTLAFNMYGAEQAEPIWFDYGFEGPRSADTIGKVSGMEDETKIAQFSRPLASETFQNFLR